MLLAGSSICEHDTRRSQVSSAITLPYHPTLLSCVINLRHKATTSPYPTNLHLHPTLQPTLSLRDVTLPYHPTLSSYPITLLVLRNVRRVRWHSFSSPANSH
eukprot:2908309-Rhodomonas_salina.3